MSKRKNSYRYEYEKEFNNVKRSLKGSVLRTAAFVSVALIWKPKVKQLFLHTMQLKSTRTLCDKLRLVIQTNL